MIHGCPCDTSIVEHSIIWRDYMARRIEDYALLSDERGAALVGRSGSIDWLCWPRFDSDACFAALIGGQAAGSWCIAPSDRARVHRTYRHDTLVLNTSFETENGRVTLTDFMIASPHQCVIRLVTGEGGLVPMRSVFDPIFGNGRDMPRFRIERDVLTAEHESTVLFLSSSRSDLARPFVDFDVRSGEQIALVLSRDVLNTRNVARFAQEQLSSTENMWRRWSAQCTYDGPWRDAVIRSLITIKALTYQPTGGIIAAPTTSLPELLGGTRNWDYRYCWLRDSTFAVLALLHSGYAEEARRWADWLTRTVDPESRGIQPVYGIEGEQDLSERELDWLAGFDSSRPVRVGNAAFRQHQLDIYGEVNDTLHQCRSALGSSDDLGWVTQTAMLDRLSKAWCEPDAGIWEQRSRPELFTQSRVLSWVAVDRAMRSSKMFGFRAPLAKWEAWRSEIHGQICRRGFDEALGAFTRAYGSRSLDAATLLMPMVGFLPAEDPRMHGTIERVAKELSHDGFIYRYNQSHEDDGIRTPEASFLPCSFWLADNWILLKQEDRAAELFEKLLGTANDVGLLAEEYDVSARSLLGNFPQTLSHLSLVHTALNLRGGGPVHTRSK